MPADPPLEHYRNIDRDMQPLYLARIEDLGRGDLVQVDCAACHHVALLRPDFLLRLGLSRAGAERYTALDTDYGNNYVIDNIRCICYDNASPPIY